MIITVIEARNDAGKIIPGMYQGALINILNKTVERLSTRRLPYGEAFAAAWAMVEK